MSEVRSAYPDPPMPRFQLADAFIIITCVAATMAIANFQMPSAIAYARLLFGFVLLPGGLSLAGLICMARARRHRPWSLGEHVFAVSIVPYALLGLAFVLRNLPWSMVDTVFRIAALLVPLFGLPSFLIVAGLILQIMATGARNGSWLHGFGFVVGAAYMTSPFALVLAAISEIGPA